MTAADVDVGTSSKLGQSSRPGETERDLAGMETMVEGTAVS